MQSKKKYFGTDGIRNRVGQGMIRPDQVLKLGWATGMVMRERGEKTVMIGKDTRISGYMFESALEAGFIAAGHRCIIVRSYANTCGRLSNSNLSCRCRYRDKCIA